MSDEGTGCLILILLILVVCTGGKILLLPLSLLLVYGLVQVTVWSLPLMKSWVIFAFSYLPGAFLFLDKRHQKIESNLRNSSDLNDGSATIQRYIYLEEHQKRLSNTQKEIFNELHDDSEALKIAKIKMQQVIDKASELNSKNSKLTCRCKACGRKISFYVDDYGKTTRCPSDKCSSRIELI